VRLRPPVLALTAALLLLAACGQKGPLVLPATVAPVAVAPAGAASSAAASPQAAGGTGR
jgi:predicted small lipoprotein YifL